MATVVDAESETNGNVKRAKNDEILEEVLQNCQIPNQNERTEKARISEQVFSIPLVLKEILKHLEFDDLLNTSLLNQHWNFFSREVLRQNRNCVVMIEEEHCCSEMKTVNEILANSETVPYSGISIVAPWLDPVRQCTFHVDLSELMGNILKKVDVKYLSIDCVLGSTCISLEDCIREIIREKASSLEVLCLDVSPHLTKTFSELFGLDPRGHWLPNVLFLEFPCGSNGSGIPTRMVEELVKASPKLQTIWGHVNVECLEFILPLQLAKAVTEFYYRPTIDSLQNSLVFALENHPLCKLSFSTTDQDYKDWDNNFSGWSEAHQNDVARIVKQLLNNSKDTLGKIAFDHSDLILMTDQWKIPVLKAVYYLRLTYSTYMDIMEGYSTLRKLEWAKYFPNLKEVCLAHQFNIYFDIDFYISNAFRESNATFVCLSVIKFCWTWSSDFADATKIHMFKKIFPNVKVFYLKGSPQFVTFLNELWTAWTDLVAIYLSVVNVDMEPSFSNYDSEFLGISTDEATYLLENVEKLESLEIVATKPCIFNLRRLKTCVIVFTHSPKLCPKTCSTSDSQSVFLSRLTGYCAFSRIPGLIVEIHRDLCMDYCGLAYPHIQPFVELVDDDCDYFGVSY